MRYDYVYVYDIVYVGLGCARDMFIINIPANTSNLVHVFSTVKKEQMF